MTRSAAAAAGLFVASCTQGVTPAPRPTFGRAVTGVSIQRVVKKLDAGPVLASIHNLTYYQRLLHDARAAIAEDRFQQFLARRRRGWEAPAATTMWSPGPRTASWSWVGRERPRISYGGGSLPSR